MGLMATASLFGVAFLAAQTVPSPPPTERHQAAAKAGQGRALAIRVRPHSRSVEEGGAASFRIHIRRRSPVGRRASVRLRVIRGLPLGATATVRPRRTRKRSTTLVVDAGTAQPGSHRLRLRARSHGKRATARVRLTIGPAASADFGISADPAAPLSPGSGVPLDLALAHSDPAAIAISRLDARVSAVSAPRATSAFPCSTADFTVTPFSGSYGFEVAPGVTSLSQLGFPPSEWPQVEMIDRAVNQDGCKGASVTLAYSGDATGGSP